MLFTENSTNVTLLLGSQDSITVTFMLSTEDGTIWQLKKFCFFTIDSKNITKFMLFTEDSNFIAVYLS